MLENSHALGKQNKWILGQCQIMDNTACLNNHSMSLNFQYFKKITIREIKIQKKSGIMKTRSFCTPSFFYEKLHSMLCMISFSVGPLHQTTEREVSNPSFARRFGLLAMKFSVLMENWAFSSKFGKKLYNCLVWRLTPNCILEAKSSLRFHNWICHQIKINNIDPFFCKVRDLRYIWLFSGIFSHFKFRFFYHKSNNRALKYIFCSTSFHYVDFIDVIELKIPVCLFVQRRGGRRTAHIYWDEYS